jgi:hypothetical protein
MGLFNSGKNEKIAKVDKHERRYEVPPGPPTRRSSKHHSNNVKAIIRPMPQPSFMPMGTNYFNAPPIFNPQGFSQMPFGYPLNSPYDLSKYSSPSVNPYIAGQMRGMNIPSLWQNIPFNNRPIFQRQPLNDYQQGGYPLIAPSNYGYIPHMQF